MLNDHWNKIFKTTSHEKLGWYEKDFSQSLKYIKVVPDLSEKVVFLPGAGTTQLVDGLLGKTKKLILNDISSEAVSILKNRLKNVKQEIEYIVSDISLELPTNNNSIDFWIDRAVLHFLTDENDINGYFNNIYNKLKVDGYVLFAEFSSNGATKCAGLDLHRYSLEELKDRCSSNFKLVGHDYYTYHNPNGGERPYIYCLFKRINK